MEIKGFEKYTIDQDGVIFSKTTGRRMKCLKHTAGYCRVALLDANGKSKFKYVHRLVAETYILNPDNKPQVNHIDGNRSNHKLTNLEWVTQSENDLHSYKNLNRKPSFLGRFGSSHPLSTKVTNGYKIYESIGLVSRDGFTPSSVCKVINGKQKQHKGYSWRQV